MTERKCKRGHAATVGKACRLCMNQAQSRWRKKHLRKLATSNRQTWIAGVKKLLKDYLKCWHITREGATLPKSSLPMLQDIRGRAELLLRTKIEVARPGKDMKTIQKLNEVHQDGR